MAKRGRFNYLKSKAKATSVADETISNKDVVSWVDKRDSSLSGIVLKMVLTYVHIYYKKSYPDRDGGG